MSGRSDLNVRLSNVHLYEHTDNGARIPLRCPTGNHDAEMQPLFQDAIRPHLKQIRDIVRQKYNDLYSPFEKYHFSIKANEIVLTPQSADAATIHLPVSALHEHGLETHAQGALDKANDVWMNHRHHHAPPTPTRSADRREFFADRVTAHSPHASAASSPRHSHVDTARNTHRSALNALRDLSLDVLKRSDAELDGGIPILTAEVLNPEQLQAHAEQLDALEDEISGLLKHFPSTDTQGTLAPLGHALLDMCEIYFHKRREDIESARKEAQEAQEALAQLRSAALDAYERCTAELSEGRKTISEGSVEELDAHESRLKQLQNELDELLTLFPTIDAGKELDRFRDALLGLHDGAIPQRLEEIDIARQIIADEAADREDDDAELDGPSLDRSLSGNLSVASTLDDEQGTPSTIPIFDRVVSSDLQGSDQIDALLADDDDDANGDAVVRLDATLSPLASSGNVVTIHPDPRKKRTEALDDDAARKARIGALQASIRANLPARKAAEAAANSLPTVAPVLPRTESNDSAEEESLGLTPKRQPSLQARQVETIAPQSTEETDEILLSLKKEEPYRAILNGEADPLIVQPDTHIVNDATELLGALIDKPIAPHNVPLVRNLATFIANWDPNFKSSDQFASFSAWLKQQPASRDQQDELLLLTLANKVPAKLYDVDGERDPTYIPEWDSANAVTTLAFEEREIDHIALAERLINDGIQELTGLKTSAATPLNLLRYVAQNKSYPPALLQALIVTGTTENIENMGKLLGLYHQLLVNSNPDYANLGQQETSVDETAQATPVATVEDDAASFEPAATVEAPPAPRPTKATSLELLQKMQQEYAALPPEEQRKWAANLMIDPKGTINSNTDEGQALISARQAMRGLIREQLAQVEENAPTLHYPALRGVKKNAPLESQLFGTAANYNKLDLFKIADRDIPQHLCWKKGERKQFKDHLKRTAKSPEPHLTDGSKKSAQSLAEKLKEQERIANEQFAKWERTFEEREQVIADAIAQALVAQVTAEDMDRLIDLPVGKPPVR